jgi:5-methylcytosine-specific restriction endonuclease McrA
MAAKRYYAKKKRPKKETYEQRNILLRELGYPTYAIYLQSQPWSIIRQQAYHIHGHTCRLCPRRATTIHHLSYTRTVLLGDDLSLLAPLCRHCHNQVEFSGKRKRTIASSQRHYYKLLYARISRLKRISSLNATAAH